MRGFLAFVVLAGCEPTTPSWDLARPAAPPPVPPAPAPAPAAPGPAPSPAPAEPTAGFDFEGDDRPPEATAVEKPSPSEASALELQARLLGVPMPETAPAAGAAAAIPDVPPTVAGFGVRVVSILADVQPPMAVLGLPTGAEIVVRPGTMVPDARLVVLAIGRQAVQVAEIVPEGFTTRVSTITVPALYPVTAAGAPPAP